MRITRIKKDLRFNYLRFTIERLPQILSFFLVSYANQGLKNNDFNAEGMILL